MLLRWIAAMALCASLWCLCGCSTAHEDASGRSAAPVRDASEPIKEISTSQLKDWLTDGQAIALIDVREDNEWQEGHAAAAMHIPRWTLSGTITTAVPDKTARIVLYCLGGARSSSSAATLQRLGYRNVFSLAGGFKQYQLAGLTVQR